MSDGWCVGLTATSLDAAGGIERALVAAVRDAELVQRNGATLLVFVDSEDSARDILRRIEAAPTLGRIHDISVRPRESVAEEWRLGVVARTSGEAERLTTRVEMMLDARGSVSRNGRRLFAYVRTKASAEWIAATLKAEYPAAIAHVTARRWDAPSQDWLPEEAPSHPRGYSVDEGHPREIFDGLFGPPRADPSDDLPKRAT